MIHDDFTFNEPFCWEDPGLSLRSMGLMKQLRTLEKSIRGKVSDLEKEPVFNKESIIQERLTLEAVQKELRRLERKTLDAELGQN